MFGGGEVGGGGGGACEGEKHTISETYQRERLPNFSAKPAAQENGGTVSLTAHCFRRFLLEHNVYNKTINEIYRFHHHHHLPPNREGPLGTTDDVATSFLPFPLFSTALWDLANSRPVHSLPDVVFPPLSLSPPFHCALQDSFGQA